MYRTNTCGELRAGNTGKKVILAGWVHHTREHGGVRFIDLRDRYGKTQIVFRPDVKEVFEVSHDLSREDVIQVEGTCVLRPEEMRKDDYPTGHIEVIAEKLTILSEAEPPVFPIEDEINVREETRLKYRYLDLRRRVIQDGLLKRHEAIQATREFLSGNGFIEIETPILMKSTPEGARDYLVPSRVNKGKFYALPQSPQTYKQLLMISGFDRYFQIARCFRDEDLRADRQPEFTQIDMEMSFVHSDDVMSVAERLTSFILEKTTGKKLTLPLQRMAYSEAMKRYGTDKPDLRFGMEIVDLSEKLTECGFGVFESTIRDGGVVLALTTEGEPDFSRKEVSEVEAKAKEFGAKGLASMKSDGTTLKGSIAKFFGEEKLEEIHNLCKPGNGDSIFFIAGSADEAYTLAGNMRNYLGKRLNLVDSTEYKALWVVNFPLFERDDAGNPTPMHHPFTKPLDEDLDSLESSPLEVRSDAYDLCLNGYEIAGGSVRIHDAELQQRAFKAIGMDIEEAQSRFGFFLDALKYGVPPHAGIAFGMDRLVMLIAQKDSIRDVMAFPKTTTALSLMEDAPSAVDQQQLDELGIKLNIKKDENG